MKPLSICVPTYNRPEKLAKLYRDFLSRAAEDFQDTLEILVCDNSDQDAAQQNQELMRNGFVRYIKNERNLGFDGNIVQCFLQSSGEFVWIISDDDAVDYQAFKRFIGWVNKSPDCTANIVMLPFINNNRLTNTRRDWGGEDSVALHAMLARAKQIPFILFSGAMVRVERAGLESRLQAIAKQFRGNDYIQCPLFLSLVDSRTASVDFYDEPLQTYQADFNGRFPLLGLVRSLEQVIAWIGEQFSLDVRPWQRKYYLGWLFWLHYHRIGQCNMREAEQARKRILWHAARNYWGIKTVILLVLNLLPVWAARQVNNLLTKYQDFRMGRS